MKPNFLVIGSAKCATTSLCALIAMHPQGFVCEPKEPHFFSVDAEYARGLSWYESLFAAAEGKTAIGDGSTSYTRRMKFPHTVDRIVEHLPDVKLIYIVRNPLAKIESQWLHARKLNLDVPAEFNEAVRKMPNYVDETSYWKQISHYRRHYPDDRILVLFYEDFKADSQAVLQRCFTFLGLDPTVRVAAAGQKFNATSDQYIDGKLMSILRLLPYFDRALSKLPQAAQRKLSRKLRKPITQRPNWVEPTRTQFIEQIRPDVEQFLTFYGKPANFWFRDKPTPPPVA